MASYTDYQPEPEDNVAAAPLGLPAAAFNGVDVGNCIRHLQSSVRNLGDSVPKLGGDPLIVAGMAAQDPAAVAITGGSIVGVPGFVPVGSILPFYGTVVEAEAHLTYGFAVCDGRTVAAFTDASGVSRGPFTMPDLRYFYLRFFYVGGDYNIPPKAELTFDERAKATALGGAHDHGGSTGGHALSAGDIPLVRNSTRAQQPGAGGFGVEDQAAGEHSHGIDEDDGHTHSVDITNPYVALVPLQRIF